MLLKKCFLPALTDETKRRCYVGHNRYRFTSVIGHHLHWSPLTIDDQRGIHSVHRQWYHLTRSRYL